MSDLSDEEKIDYIFNHIKLEKKGTYLKYSLKIILFWVLIYWYFYVINNFSKEAIIERITTEITSLSRPIVDSMVKDMQADMTKQYDDLKWKAWEIEISDDLLNKIKSSDLLKEKFKK